MAYHASIDLTAEEVRRLKQAALDCGGITAKDFILRAVREKMDRMAKAGEQRRKPVQPD